MAWGSDWRATAAPGDQKWVFPTGGAVSSCPALGDDGTIYFGSADTNVYAVDGATGRSKWTFPTGGAINSSAAIGADGTVYIGSSDHKLYALAGATGAKKWEFMTGGTLASPSIGMKGTVYVASGDNGIYALDGATGSNIWTFVIETPEGVNYPPDSLAIGVDNTVYFVQAKTIRSNGMTMPYRTLVALNGATGAVLWQAGHPSITYGTILPAIDEFGRVCMVYESAPALEFYDGRTGQVAWSSSYYLWGRVYGLPIMGKERMIYISTHSGRPFHYYGGLTAFNTRTGQEAWVLDGVYLATLVLGADGTLHGSSGATLLALDGATGRTNWQFQAGGEIRNSPTLGRDGTVYFSAANGVYAVEGTSVGGLADSAWPKLNRDARNTGCLPVFSTNHPPVLTVPGTQVVDELTTLTVTNTATDADLPDTTLIFGLDAAPKGAVIDPSTGVLTWTPTEAQGASTNTMVVRVTDNGVPNLSASNSFVVIVNATNQIPVYQQWMFPTGGAISECPTLGPDGTVYIGSGDGRVYALDGTNGSQRWEFPTGGPVKSSPALGPDATLYLGSLDKNIYALDIQTGARKWAVKTSDWVFGTPALAADGTVYAASYDGVVHAVDGRTGAQKWRYRTGGPLHASPALGSDGTVYVGTQDGRVFALNGGANGGLAHSPWPKFHRDPRNTGNALSGEVNHAPTMISPLDQVMDELTTLRVTNRATDVDVPSSLLTFNLVSAPDGVALEPATGVLTWTPTEAQRPSTNRILVRVTDNGVPPLSGTNSFTVVVNEVNSAPVLTAAMRNYTVVLGATLVFTNTATDSDVPANSLTYLLDLGAPPGAAIDRNTGVFTWTASGATGTNQFTIWVTDDGVPYRSDAKPCIVVTLPKPRDLQFGGIQRDAGGQIVITWEAKAGARYQLQSKNRLEEPDWIEVGTMVTAASETVVQTDPTATAGQRFYRVVQVEN